MRFHLSGLVVFLLIILTACGLKGEQNVPTPGQLKPGASVTFPSSNEEVENQGNQIWIMSFYDLGEEFRKQIRKQFSHLEVEFSVTPLINGIETYRQTYNSDKVPDIFIMDSSSLGSFNDSNTFENLSMEPYHAEAIIELYPDNLKKPLRSLDKMRLLALPVYTSPAVTFYRYDILKEAGFPAEPEALAAFMEDSNNWLNMAKTLKEQGYYINAWVGEPSFYLEYAMGMFDDQMNYLRNTMKVREIMELARETMKLELASNSNIFELSELNSITLGKTVMLHSGLLYENILKEVGSNTAGNWRITTMPFGLYGLSGHAVAAISSNSNHKTKAWSVLKWMAEADKNKLMDITNEVALDSEDNFYGGQHIAPLLHRIIERFPGYQLTPVDERAKTIWWRIWYESMADSNISTEVLLNNIEEAVNKELNEEITLTREFLKQQPD